MREREIVKLQFDFKSRCEAKNFFASIEQHLPAEITPEEFSVIVSGITSYDEGNEVKRIAKTFDCLVD